MSKRTWLVVGLLLFTAAGLVVAVAIGGGSRHPEGEITVASATPPGATMVLEDSGSCHPDFPGWSGLGTFSDDGDAAAWFDDNWGPIVEPWTSRRGELVSAGEWRYYGSLAVLLRDDRRFVVRTFQTLDHSCPGSSDAVWGGIPVSAWASGSESCPDTTIVTFAGISYDPKRDAAGGTTTPTDTPPRGWQQRAYANGGEISYLDSDPDEIVVKLPDATQYQRYGIAQCVPAK